VTAPDTIAWQHVAESIDLRCAMDAAMLARALRSMDLVREHTLLRGDVPGWPPVYERLVPWRLRYATSDTIHARGWRDGAWGDAAGAYMDAQDERERQHIAARNRALRDAPVFVLSRRSIANRDARRAARAAALSAWLAAERAWWASARPQARARPSLPAMILAAAGDDPPDIIFLELDTHAWRDHTGAAIGEGLGALAAFAWRCGRGRALARLARVVGVELLGTRDLDRRVAQAEAMAHVAA
jgi:hypothetical protein